VTKTLADQRLTRPRVKGEVKMTAEEFYTRELPRGEINNFLSYELADDPTPEYQRKRIFQFAEAYAARIVSALNLCAAPSSTALSQFTSVDFVEACNAQGIKLN
jgi:hypothetical protein